MYNIFLSLTRYFWSLSWKKGEKTQSTWLNNNNCFSLSFLNYTHVVMHICWCSYLVQRGASMSCFCAFQINVLAYWPTRNMFLSLRDCSDFVRIMLVHRINETNNWVGIAVISWSGGASTWYFHNKDALFRIWLSYPKNISNLFCSTPGLFRVVPFHLVHFNTF